MGKPQRVYAQPQKPKTRWHPSTNSKQPMSPICLTPGQGTTMATFSNHVEPFEKLVPKKSCFYYDPFMWDKKGIVFTYGTYSFDQLSFRSSIHSRLILKDYPAVSLVKFFRNGLLCLLPKNEPRTDGLLVFSLMP